MTVGGAESESGPGTGALTCRGGSARISRVGLKGSAERFAVRRVTEGGGLKGQEKQGLHDRRNHGA